MCKSFRMLVVLLLRLVTSVQAQPPGRQRGRGPFGGGAAGLLALLASMTEVQKELNVNDIQEKLLDALVSDLREQQRSAFRRGFNGPRGDRDEQLREVRRHMQELNAQGEKLMATIFESEQQVRFNQLRVQYEGVRALDRDEISKALGLTDTQLQVIREIRESDDGSRDGGVRRSGQEREADIVAVFTKEQKEKWDHMQGETFAFPPRPRSYGRRGFRGSGRGSGERPRRSTPPSDR